MKLRPRSVLILFTVVALSTCIDPYAPHLAGYDSLLVVDGLVTNENSAYEVRLSRTFQGDNSSLDLVSDATLSITDDNGFKTFLKNLGSGIYKTNSTEFIGSIGRTYVLHILTSDNVEYVSNPCTMSPVSEIDSIYFEKDEQLTNNSTQSLEGVRIYLDSKWEEGSAYYRWSFDETWKFKVPFPKKYDFLFDINGHDTWTPIPVDGRIIPVNDVKEYCWKNHHSDDIVIGLNLYGQDHLQKQPLFFIATDQSDRLLLKYSILVKQYSISKEEYKFWNELKQVDVAGGDIFARQPYAVVSNIHNTKKPGERILGFFKVSAVTQKRKYISVADIVPMNLPYYHHDCVVVAFEPLDFETRCKCPPKTWDDVYWYLCIQSNYTFINPIFDPGTMRLRKMVFTNPECADCELTGTSNKPDFWDDGN